MSPALTTQSGSSPQNIPFTDMSLSPCDKNDISKYRSLVPAVTKDNAYYVNASFQPPMNLRVHAAIDTFLDQAVETPHPKPGWQSTAQEAQSLLASYLHVLQESIVFTRDTTEGLNLFQRSIPFTPGANVLLLDSEHPNHVYGWLGLVEQRLEVRRINTRGETFAPYVDEKTIAIGLSAIMFRSRQMNDVQGICTAFRGRGVHVLVDIAHHVGVAPINLAEWGVSAAAFGCHKGLGCPSGLGALYIDPNVLPQLKPVPPIVGAGAIANLPSTLLADSDVRYYSSPQRYSHLNMSLIGTTALKASLKLLCEEIGMDRIEKHLRSLGYELARGLAPLGVRIVGSKLACERAPHLYVLALMHPDWERWFRDSGVLICVALPMWGEGFIWFL
ncbi:PLP-dependent transferase [Aspergillus ellipticus CBS 707.79]|uniref:PLP-dependent transferase n=1 Tax=Aspergillus ellipticus CBS 707.79 TaxID=1448320 RepID=A0A319DCA6_9EURO|nr:PLP-dependent transferase [Aspergillus ellipticus CBS 707.79]